MEKFSPETVYQIAVNFEQLRSNCNLIERFGEVRFAGSKIEAGQMESIQLRTSRSIRTVGEDWKSAFITFLQVVQHQGSKIGLDLAVKAAKDYLDEVERGQINSYTHMEKALVALDKVITLQLRNNLFMFVPSDRASYYSQAELFGEQVNRRFPQCQQDIEEAGSCYASGRGTAVAFHLMRVMEATVQELGAALGITLTNEKDWHNILEEVNKAIKKLPAKAERTIKLSQVSGNLYNVKLAWRNPTMHPKIIYTMEEARDLLLSVQSFARELADVLTPT